LEFWLINYLKINIISLFFFHLSARFPNSFKPNLAKLINEVDPNSSAAATNDEEETLEERAINNGAFNGQKVKQRGNV
jgi:hypothetical protein